MVGHSAELCRFRERYSNASDSIKLEWQGTPSAEDAIEPAKFDQHEHRQVNFLDLDITIVYSQASADFAFKVGRKPGSAYAYLPFGSHYARHVFRGWLKTKIGMQCVLLPPTEQRISNKSYQLHVSCNQIEPVQRNAGVISTCAMW
jgi:hypothetical protein